MAIRIRAPVLVLVHAVMFTTAWAAFAPVPVRTQEIAGAEIQAALAAGAYERAEALARSRVEALKAIRGEQSTEAAAASDLLVQALLLNGRGAAQSTLALAETAAHDMEAYAGASDPALVPSLLNLGGALVEAAQYKRAIDVVQRAVTIRQQSTGSDPIELAEALDNLGGAFIGGGRYDDALRVLERSLRLKESTPGAGALGIARTLDAIGWARQRKGDYEQAGAPIRRAVAIQEKAYATHPAYAETLNLLGLQLWFEGNLPAARDASKQALAIAEGALRPDHPTIALSLRYLAGAILDLGDLQQARTLLERALAIAEQTFGPNHHESGRYLNDLAGPTRLLGDYPRARKLFERSLTIAEETFGPFHDRVATAVHNLALVDASLGNYANARREQARATAIWERLLGRNHPFVALALTELAAVYRDQGSPGEALPLLERALLIREQSLGPNHRDVAAALVDVAATLMQLGRADRAQAAAARALGIWEQAGTPDAPDFATALGLYAQLQADRGDIESARRYYDRALAIRERVFGRSLPVFAAMQTRLAHALADVGEETAAFATAVEAETTGREHLRAMVRYLPEQQALNYAAHRPRGLDLILSLAETRPDGPTVSFDALIRSRALVLDEIAARHKIDAAHRADLSALWEQVASPRQRLANLIVRGPAEQSAATHAALIEEVRAEIEGAEGRLAEQSAPFSAELSRAKLGLERVHAALPANAALVSFTRYGRRQSTSTTLHPAAATATTARRPPSRTEASYLAFVLKQDTGEVTMVQLGAADPIDALVTAWRRALVGSIGGETLAPPSGASLGVLGVSLRRKIWDPIVHHLDGASRVFVVPDGALNLVPLAALPTSRNHYLLEDGPVIHYLSSERDLIVETGATAPTGGLLSVGGPDFTDGSSFARLTRSRPVNPPATSPATPLMASSPPAEKAADAPFRGVSSGCVSFQSMRFEALPGSRREAEDIATLWKQLGSESGEHGMTTEVMTGSKATEEAFKRSAAVHRVIHLATHGFFLGDDCAPMIDGTRSVGGLVSLSGKKTAQPAPAKRRRRAEPPENPLLLSGLALAGANRRMAAAPSEDDGILTAEEVAALNLAGVEWAVLSACDTGLGEVRAGEGVFGLRRAFQVAGVRTVIMSLWSVEDRSAHQWTEALYRARLGQHLDTADAVRDASLAVLHARRASGQSTHPYYWAGFVAAGDWR